MPMARFLWNFHDAVKKGLGSTRFSALPPNRMALAFSFRCQGFFVRAALRITGRPVACASFIARIIRGRPPPGTDPQLVRARTPPPRALGGGVLTLTEAPSIRTKPFAVG